MFDLIVADPPWRYSFSKSPTRKIENHYSTMTVEEIGVLGKDLPVAEDSLLYLWATAPKLREALEIMETWGYSYKTHGIWDKQIIGMGYWFRGQHEIILVGTRGKFSPPDPSKRISSILTERRSKHSKKPQTFYQWVDEAYPTARKLELFARTTRPGWASWGDEISGVSLEELSKGLDS